MPFSVLHSSCAYKRRWKHITGDITANCSLTNIVKLSAGTVEMPWVCSWLHALSSWSWVDNHEWKKLQQRNHIIDRWQVAFLTTLKKLFDRLIKKQRWTLLCHIELYGAYYFTMHPLCILIDQMNVKDPSI
jgi:hypothetical protein